MNGPRVAAIVQARMSSVRLPGKVLSPLHGVPALRRMMRRLAQMKSAEWTVVATSTEPTDDPIAAACRDWGIPCSRGALDDVLARFLAALPQDCDTAVRLTGDCPLIDPEIADRHVALFASAAGEVDYVTNAVERTMPDGLDVEVFSREILERAQREATDAYDREHCTPWIRRHGRIRHLTQAVDLSELRWTLDTVRDHEVISEIFRYLDLPERSGGGAAAAGAIRGYDSVSESGETDCSSSIASTAYASSSVAVYKLLLAHPELIHLAGTAEPTPADRKRICARIEEHLARITQDAP